MGLFDGFKKLVGGATDPSISLANENDGLLKTYMQQVEKINGLESVIEKLSNENLVDKTREFKSKLAAGASLDSILIEAFAVVREASWRVLKLRWAHIYTFTILID